MTPEQKAWLREQRAKAASTTATCKQDAKGKRDAHDLWKKDADKKKVKPKDKVSVTVCGISTSMDRDAFERHVEAEIEHADKLAARWQVILDTMADPGPEEA